MSTLESILFASVVAWLLGATLLSFALGWQLGLGISLMVWFFKGIER